MRIAAAVLLISALAAGAGWGLDQNLVAAAEAAMHKGTDYFRSEVAYGGGYLGTYLSDLSDQWGEGHASRTQNWIQPPGSPSVGFAFLRAWEATGDQFYLDGAREVADALVYGQLECGGWYYIVDHAPAGARRYYYLHNKGSDDESLTSGRNQATFDDNVTQHATRLLMAVDQALDEKDKPIHDAALYALDFMLEAQHESGGWSQRYPYSGRGYADFFTFNDNTIRDCTDVMMIAYRTYGDERYAEAVRKCGDFIVNAQLPEPQAVWAQQYDFDLKPAWARRFEPPGPCGGESSGVLSLLVEIALFTGDTKYVEPIPKALDWYKRSQLPNGRWARFYELKTNRPLFLTSDNRTTYWLTYDDGDLPDHYSFNRSGYPRSTEQAYNAIKQQGLDAYARSREPRPMTGAQKIARAEGMEDAVRQVVAELDEKGRWLTTSGGRELISTSVFQQKIGVLSRYVRLARGR
ncbi:MAG: pectate lyase [Armatimonadota bacterium]